MLDERHRALCEDALTWALRHCACDRGVGWHASRAFIATTFEVLCSSAVATELESRLCARYILVFLAADDGSAADLAGFGGDLGPYHRALLADLTAAGLPPAGVEEAFTDLVASMVTEEQTDPATLSWAELRALRYRTVGVVPYIRCRLAARRLTFADPEVVTGAIDRSVEHVYLVNDLASADQPRPGGRASLDTVGFLTRRLGRRDAAVGEVLGWLHRATTEVEAALRALAATGEPAATALAEILLTLVNGNLDGHRYLVELRYPGAADRLSKLRYVAPPE